MEGKLENRGEFPLSRVLSLPKLSAKNCEMGLMKITGDGEGGVEEEN